MRPPKVQSGVRTDVDEVADAHGDAVDERRRHAAVRRHAHANWKPVTRSPSRTLRNPVDWMRSRSSSIGGPFLEGQPATDAAVRADSSSTALRAPRTAIATLMSVGFIAVAVGMRALPPTTRFS